MEERDVVLQVHGEATGDDVDPYDRESVFIERELAPLVQRHPRLRIVLEHVTTRAGVEFVRAAGERIAATITPQHLLYNRGAMFRGGLRPHLYCLPVLKRERDRESLVEAATSDDARFFLGTDSAPHARSAKESSCGCAGVFSAPAAIELYARAFDERTASTVSKRSQASMARISTACRATGDGHARARGVDRAGQLAFRRGEIVPMCAGEHARMEVAQRGGTP